MTSEDMNRLRLIRNAYRMVDRPVPSIEARVSEILDGVAKAAGESANRGLFIASYIFEIPSGEEMSSFCDRLMEILTEEGYTTSEVSYMDEESEAEYPGSKGLGEVFVSFAPQGRPFRHGDKRC